MSGSTRLVAACALAASLARGSLARASAFDVHGFGHAGIAECGARAARADDGTASYYNPAGLGLGSGYHVELAPTVGVSALEAQGETVALEEPFGVAFAFDATIPFEGVLSDRIRFGFGGYFPPAGALHLVTRSGQTPFFPYYDNRTQRMVVLPALGVRILDGLSIGGGINVLAGVSGPADVRPGASGAPESRIDEEVTTVMAAVAGLRFDPVPAAHFAFVFRQGFSVPSVVTTTAEVGGVPLAVDVDPRQALFDPDTFVVGASVEVGRAVFELDASLVRWSEYEGPFVDVSTELPGVALRSSHPQDMFRDVVSLRGASTVSLDVGARSALLLRLGAGYEGAALKDVRQGRTNLLDGDKVLAGLGATLVLRDVLPRTVRVGLGANVNVVTAYEQDKRVCQAQPCPADTVVGDDPANPGAGITNPGYPTLEGGGTFWSMGLGLGVDL